MNCVLCDSRVGAHPSQSERFLDKKDLDKQESVAGRGDHSAAEHGYQKYHVLWGNERVGSNKDYWVVPNSLSHLLALVIKP